MAVIEELIREEENGALSFGNYELTSKTKKDGFEYMGDSYKIKTFNEITKLEKNGSFVYESVPGTAVHEFRATGDKVEFVVEGNIFVAQVVNFLVQSLNFVFCGIQTKASLKFHRA